MKRYDFDIHADYSESVDGGWIRYSDHVEAMRRIAGDSAQQEPVAWFEADESARGGDIRTLIRSLVHSTRWHWQSERPVTGNPVWPHYAAPAPSASPADPRMEALAAAERQVEESAARRKEREARLGLSGASPAALTDEAFNAWSDEKCLSIRQHELYKRGYDFARALLAASPAPYEASHHSAECIDGECSGCIASPGDQVEIERLRRISWLIGSIFVHGNFVAETFNERELESLLRKQGTFWETLSEFDAALSASKEGA